MRLGASILHLHLDMDRLRVVRVLACQDEPFGYLAADLLGLDAFVLFPRWWGAAKSLRGERSVLTFLRRKDGGEDLVDALFSPVEHEGDRCLSVQAGPLQRPLTEVERELVETSRYLHLIVENIPDMIFVKDADSHAFRRFNRAGEALLGFTRGELLGKTDHDFYPREQADFFHDKDRETFRRGEIVDIPQEPIQTKYKGRRVLHTRKIPIYDEHRQPLYLLGISEDITERVEAERIIREFAAVVQHLRDAVVTFQPDGTIVSWNPGAEHLYGLPSQDAVGRSFFRFVPESQMEEFRDRLQRVARGEQAAGAEVTRLRSDGRERDVEETLLGIGDPAGGIHRFACIGRDSTEVVRWRRATEMLSASQHAQDLASYPGPASERTRELMRAVEILARQGDATVLLLGETGVGKSFIARRIHEGSPRAGKPFFEINCAGLAPPLVESELFGHERGAFTSAQALKRGLVETADGGTLLLDEVGELGLAVQGQLLTFLDNKTFRRVGGSRQLVADVRILAATNMDLAAAVERGSFRRDLYYRLNVVPLVVPPLRERKEEIGALAGKLLSELSRRAGRPCLRLSPEAMEALAGYPWPGNVRELRNVLERLLIFARGDEIGAADLPPEMRAPGPGPSPDRRDAAGLKALDQVEREEILRALEATRGNRTRAAEHLGISRSTLKRRLSSMKSVDRAGSR